MQRCWLLRIARERIHRPESAGRRVQVPGAVVVEAEGGVVLFAGEEVVVGGRAGGVDEVAEGVVVVGIYSVFKERELSPLKQNRLEWTSFKMFAAGPSLGFPPKRGYVARRTRSPQQLSGPPTNIPIETATEHILLASLKPRIVEGAA